VSAEVELWTLEGSEFQTVGAAMHSWKQETGQNPLQCWSTENPNLSIVRHSIRQASPCTVTHLIKSAFPNRNN